MDAILQTLKQYARLYSDRTAAEKTTIAAVTMMLVAGFGFLIFRGSATGYDALSWGKVFTTEELAAAEQALRDAGLDEFRRDGQRIMVPRKDAARYNAALFAAGSLPSHSASELEKQLEKSNVFTSRDQLQALKDVALEKELSRVIRAVPGIEDATVRWARSQTQGWGRKTKVTATVSVRPRKGRELGRELVQSLRAAVANMVPDLAVADVAVFDQSTGQSHAGESGNDPLDNRIVQRIREFARDYEQRVRQALDYIPGVSVTVNVDVDNVRRSAERSTKLNPKETVALQQNEENRTESFRDQPVRAEPGAVPNRPLALETRNASEKSRTVSETSSNAVTAASWTVTDTELLAAMPKGVRVSVSIPRDYYRGVALKNGLNPGTSDDDRKKFEQAVDQIAKDEEAKAKLTARTLIPAGSPEEAVHVMSIVRVEAENAQAAIPWTATAMSLVSDWGGVVAIALFAAWALRMLMKTMPKLPELPPEPTPTVAPTDGPTGDATPENEMADLRSLSPRDRLQSIVRDDPEAAAAVISKWLQAAK